MTVNFAAALMAMSLVSKLGRRPLLLPSLFVMAACLMMMCPVYAMIHNGELSSAWCFVLLFGYIIGFEVCHGSFTAVCLSAFLCE